MKKEERLSAFKAKQYNPMALAYLGDAVYELMVRERLALTGNLPVGRMHEAALSYVKAGAQSAALIKISAMLTEEEEAVFRRGRNAKSNPGRRNIELSEYKCATGLETLFGYLHLQGKEDRLHEIFEALCDVIEHKNTKTEEKVPFQVSG